MSKFDETGGATSRHDETLDLCPGRLDDERERLNVTNFDNFKGTIGNISEIIHDVSPNASKLDFGDLLSDLVMNEKTGNLRNYGKNEQENRRHKAERDIEKTKTKKEELLTRGSNEMSTDNSSNRRSSQENERMYLRYNNEKQVLGEHKRRNTLDFKKDNLYPGLPLEKDFESLRKRNVIVYGEPEELKRKSVVKEVKPTK